MVDVESLSDAEIRTKLIEFGFPVMPITGTTRKIMVKKLKLLMDSSKGKSGGDRRSLGQFSSEEESDVDVKTSKKDKNRRATMAVVTPMQPPASNKVTLRKSVKKTETENDIIESKNVVVEERKTRTTQRIVESADNDTNSDSEPDIVETDYKISPKNHYEKRESPIKSSFFSKPRDDYSPPKQADSSVTSRTTSYTSFSPSRYSSYNSPSLNAEDKLNQIRSRLSLGGTSNYESPYAASSQPDTNLEAGDAPFLSNFTKRLSQLSSTKTPGSGYENKTDVIKEHDSNGSSMYTRSFLSKPKPREYSQSYQSAQERNSKGNNISVLLVGSVALFFVVLAVVYWGLHSGINGTDLIDLKVPLCDVKNFDMRKGWNCIVESDKQGAVDLYQVIKPELIKRAVAHRCSDAAIKPHMTEQDVVTFVKNNYGLQDEFQILEDFFNFIIVLHYNPLFEVSVLQNQVDEFSDKNKMNTLSEIFKNKEGGFTTALAVLSPTLPMSCTLYNSFLFVFKGVALAVTACGIWWLLKKSYKYYKFYEQRRKDEIILMVEKIIDILQSEENEKFLVINHIRDMILPINNRKKMEQTWLKAVRFISENESRVRTEVQVVHGEPYEVWRWVGGLNTSIARNKSWQGQAFETQVGSVNSPPCSPTPCLKIRGMVDDGDRNLHTIREAVLVKCADQCRILHCAVDVNSKCVYLKCADQNDAAIAYRNLHGWWYASHLVTVKYLRLERYMQRFADSPQSGPPFLKAHQSM